MAVAGVGCGTERVGRGGVCGIKFVAFSAKVSPAERGNNRQLSLSVYKASHGSMTLLNEAYNAQSTEFSKYIVVVAVVVVHRRCETVVV